MQNFYYKNRSKVFNRLLPALIVILVIRLIYNLINIFWLKDGHYIDLLILSASFISYVIWIALKCLG